MSLSPLSVGVLIETPVVRVSVEPSPARLNLRARGDLSAIKAALGLSLPAKIAERSEAAGLVAAKLGPDEWSLTGPAPRAQAAAEACAAVYAEVPHSLVDISGREVVLMIEGPAAADLLTFSLARDLAAVAPGTSRRTLFDGATVVLHRDAPGSFRMDVWRSFAPHLAHLMVAAAKELAAEAA